MPKFRFTITTDVTMSAQVEVEADTIEDAHDLALTPSFYENAENAKFELDDGNPIREVYLPDDTDWEVVPDAPKLG